MIDLAIAVALGAIATALLGLAVLPVLWWRALRVTRRRLEAEMPLSLQEVRAGRDLIRAEAAVSAHRLEQALAEEQARRAGLLADLTRAGDQVRAAEADAAEAERIAAGRQEEIERFQNLEEELATARRQVVAASAEVERARDRTEVAETAVHAGRIELAALATRNGVLEDRLHDSLRQVDELIAAGVERDGRIALQEAELGRHQAAIVGGRERMSDQERIIATLQDRLHQAGQERARAWERIQADNDDLRAVLKQVALEIARAAVAGHGPVEPG